MILTGRMILRYITLPQIIPRCRDLFGSGFGFIAYSMACVLQNTRLLTLQHPYCNAVNMGKFGIRDVLAQAALNLKFSLKHTDQILIFFLLMAGAILLLMQIGMIGLSLFVQAAHASPSPLPGFNFANWFLSPNPEQDISFMILDRIFGIPGIFDSCVSLSTPCLDQPVNSEPFPYAYHAPMRAMLAFYSQGLLWVAAIILIYHVTTLIAEMSQTGTFFGRRFNKVWGPLRMVAAIGLLLPMNNNLNAAQYISLYIAKWGSGFATNAWNFYLADVTAPSTVAGPHQNLVAKPKPASSNDLLQFMAMAQTCFLAYNKAFNYAPADMVDAYVVRKTIVTPPALPSGTSDALFSVMNFFLDNNLHGIQRWYNYGDVVIVFGRRGTGSQYEKYRGNVIPLCGEIQIQTTRIADQTTGQANGIDYVTYQYIKLIDDIWNGPLGNTPNIMPVARAIVDNFMNDRNDPANPYPPDPATITGLIDDYDTILREIVDEGYVRMTDANASNMWFSSANTYGWAGAGIWYNKIAQINGHFVGAVANVPMVVKYPMISEMVQAARQSANASTAGENRFDPNLGDTEKGEVMFKNRNDRDKQIALALNAAYKLFVDVREKSEHPSTGNPFIDGINALFKKTGLWSLRENREIHPLASMASLGKTLLTNSVIAFGMGTAAGLVGTLGKKSMPQALAKSLSSFLLSVAYVGITAGVLLYYIVPLLPFIYFSFATLSWAKVIFESMVGTPLWALAHLRYDGHGFPTAQSMYGYYLLVDLFIRPVLIVFGLVASVTIFYALAKTLNNVFDVVVLNMAGFDHANTTTGPTAWTDAIAHQRGPIDQLAFMIVYAVVMYMMALSSFKMIDAFPNSVLRWMGSGSQGFGSRSTEDAGQTVAGGLKEGSGRLSMSMNSAVEQIGSGRPQDPVA